MDYQNASQYSKRMVLENAVLTKSPEEIVILYQQLGEVECSARALGLACRFCGLAHVKALVENGANFTYTPPYLDSGYYSVYYWLSPLEMNDTLLQATFIKKVDECFKNVITVRGNNIKVLPMQQRAEIVKYLYEHREEVCLDAGELLFYAIISNNTQIIRVLKEYGVTFSKNRIINMSENGRGYEWFEFCNMLDKLGDKEYMEIVDTITKELDGKRLHYTNSIYWGNYNEYGKQYRLYKPEFFSLFLITSIKKDE